MGDSTPVAERVGFWRVPGRVEMLFFYCTSFGLGCWLVRLPDIQVALDLSKAELATALLGFPIGSLVILLVCNRLVSWLGLRRMWITGHVSLYLIFPTLGLASSQAWLFVSMFCLGMFMMWVQTMMNIQVDRTERESGVYAMSRCHGFFMMGLLSGSLIGVASSALGLSTAVALLACSTLMLPMGLVAILASPSHVLPPSRLRRGPGLPPAGFLGVVLFLVGNTVSEGVVASWSTIYLIEVLGEPSPYAGLGFTTFVVTFAIGRFSGDHLRDRIGARLAARVFCVVSLLAATLIAYADSVPTLVAGYGLLGIGVALGFPYAMTAATALSKETTASAAWLAFTAMMGFQFGPVVYGYLAELTSLRVAFAALLPLLVLSMLATRILPERLPRQAAPKA